MEERLEERPTKKVKLGHAAPNGGHVLVPALQMAVVDGGDERDQVRYSGADITEAREVDVNGSDDSVSDDDADGEMPRQQIVSAPSLSKNALKKLRNKERWDAGRDARKLKRKQKLAEKRIRKQAAKEEAQATKEAAKRPETPKRPMHTCLPITFIIDCGFDNLMTERERISLGSQLTRSYSDNHKAPFQAYMIVSSWGGQLKERFDTVLEKHHENWRGVTFMEADFVAAGQRAKELMRGTTIGKLAGAFGAGRSANVSLGNSSEHTAEKAADGKLAAKEEDLESGKPPSAVANSEEQEHVPVEDLASVARQDGGRQEDDRAIEPELPTNEPFEHSTQTTAAELVPSSAVEGPQDGEIIYLTSDSPHTLDRLQPYSSYVVGGLVDKNRHKGICYKTACARGIKTAKLPIGDFLEMQSRFVLATNHVVEIMVRWLECGDWGEAFLKVMPKRKGGVLKAPSASKHDVLAVELGVEDSTPGSTVSREDEAHSKGGDMLETDIHSVPTVS